MQKDTPKKIRTVNIPPETKKKPSRPPKKTGLCKSDPDYYKKIGLISAQKRKLPKEFFSEMARKSHKNRDGYKGGRKRKEDQPTEEET